MTKKEKKAKQDVNQEAIIRILTIIGMPITIIADIIAIVSSFNSDSPLALYIAIPLIAISFTLILFYAVIYILKRVFITDKAKEKLEIEYLNTSYRVAKKTHGHFHRFRDIIESTGSYNSVSKDYVKQVAVSICDSLAFFYSTLLEKYLDKYSVSVCIKLIDPNTMSEEDTDKWLLETLARSVSTEQSRNNMDKNKVLVSDNSDFGIILSDKYDCPYFACPNLEDIHEIFRKNYNLEYRNSRVNFIKHYRSTIVMPIKIDAKNLSSEQNKISSTTNQSLYFGFLCIDSYKTFTTKNEKKAFDAAVEYAKGFADSLVLYLEKVSVTRQNLLTQNS